MRPQENGRRVQGINREARDELALAKQALYGVLGERDPVKFYRAVQAALGAIDQTDKRMEEIEMICRLAAVKGPNSANREEPTP